MILFTVSLISFSFLPSPSFFEISFVPNLIGIGIKRLYFFKRSPIVFSSRKLFESLDILRIISVPLFFLSDLTKLNSGDPSQDQ